MTKKTDRRQFIKAVALTCSSLGVGLTALRDRALASPFVLGTNRFEQERLLRRMLSPIEPGSELVGTLVESISINPKRLGQVTLIDPNSDELVTVEICLRDPDGSPYRAVGRTKNYLLFLKNEGAGSKVTPEHIGLSVLALAEILQNREASFERLALITERDHMKL